MQTTLISKILFILLALGINQFTTAQTSTDVYINTSKFRITRDVDFFINGSLKVDTEGNIDNGGNIIVTDSVINDAPGLFMPSSYGKMDNQGDSIEFVLNIGYVTFPSDSKQHIINNDLVIFDTIIMNSGDSLILHDSINMVGQLEFTRGYFNLNQKALFLYYQRDSNDLRSYGTLGNERNDCRIIDATDIGFVDARKYLTDSGKDQLGSIGIEPHRRIGLTGMKRFHFHDTLVTDTSIGKVFELYLLSQENGSTTQSSFYYLDDADLLPSITEDSLIVWNQRFKEDISDFDASYAKIPALYMMSEANNMIDVDQDTAAGTIILQRWHRYTLAEKNCDDLPDVNLGNDTVLCSGRNVKFSAFKDETLDWTDYFYQWGTSVDINTSATRSTVYEYSFSTDSVPSDSSFQLWAKVRDHKGCTNTDTVNIIVNSSSKIGLKLFEPDMTPSEFSICAGDSFIIIDTCNADTNDYKYTWRFENDTLDDYNSKIFHTLNIPGDTISFNVKYVNQYGCVSNKPGAITVNPLPTIGLSLDNTACANTYAEIINNSTIPVVNPVASITRYKWQIDTLDVIDVIKGTISSEKGSDFVSEEFTYENTSPDIEFLFTTEGNYTLTLEALSSASCMSADSIDIYVNPSVTASFTADESSNVCNGNLSILAPDDSCTVVNDSSYSWLVNPFIPWINGDTASYLFPSAGSYSVSLAIESDSGCVDTTTREITIHPNAMANFNVKNHCFDSTTVVRNTSTNSNSYLWDFGNGTTSTQADNSLTYVSAGIYTIKLVANNNWNCLDSVEKEVEIYPLPNVSFNVGDNICINEQNSIVENTSDIGLNFNWNFGDGTFSTLRNPAKVYADANNYLITLTGKDEHGCVSDSTLPVRINNIVNAAYDPGLASVCAGTTSLFQLNGPLIDLDSVSWIFGDGTEQQLSVTEATTDYIYGESGMFLASLVTFSIQGCKDTLTSEVIIAPNPGFDIITEGQNCARSEIIFRMNDDVTVGDIASYEWNFGDFSSPLTNTSTIPAPGHFYNEPGNYNVSLHAATHQGCHGYDTIQITIDSLPEIPFADLTATCENSLELIAGPPSYTYLWYNGSTTPSIIVNHSGMNSVTVTNPATGCSNYKETYVELSETVNAGLGNDAGACDFLLLDAHNPGSTYEWSTGDTTRTIQVDSSGTYSVIVTDLNECVGYDTINVTINPSPVVNLPRVSSFCDGESAVLNPGATSGDFIWSTGETTDSIEVTDPGYYWLEVTDANGCSDHGNTNVIINPVPVVSLGGYIELCENVSLTLNAGNINSTYDWNTGESTQSIDPLVSGEYFVDVTNIYGCIGNDTVDVVFNPLPDITLGDNQSLCDGQELTLDAGNAALYYWSTNVTTQSIVVRGEGDYWVRVTDQNNCTNLSDVINVEFREKPEAPFISDTIEGCNYALIDANNPNSSYLWHDGSSMRNYYTETSGLIWVEITNTENCSLRDSTEVYIKPKANLDLPASLEICNNSHDFINAGYFGDDYAYLWNTGSTEQYIEVSSPGWYNVNVTHSEGCVATDSTLIISIPALDINLNDEVVMCSNSGFSLDAGNQNGIYFWENDSGQTYHSPIWEIPHAGKYWVYVMAENGCSNSDTTVVLETNMSIMPHFMSASKIKIGDTVRFVDLSVPEPDAYFWEFGDMIWSDLKEPTHIYYTEDTFDVTLTVYNDICSASISKPVTVSGYNPYYLIKMRMENETRDINLIKILEAGVFPNPVTDYVNLKLKISEPAKVIYYLYNINGRILSSKRFNNVEEMLHTINISGYARGLYFLRVQTRNEAKTFKILKIN